MSDRRQPNEPTNAATFRSPFNTVASVVLGGAMTFAALLVLGAALPASADAPASDKFVVPNFDGVAMPQRAEPIANYALRASLDPTTHQIKGEGTIVWKNASTKPQSEIWLHLYLNAFKNEKTIYRRTVGRGFRGEPGKSDFGWIRVSKLFARELDKDLWASADKHSPDDPDDETDIRVPLPRAIEPGQTLTLDVAWLSDLPEVTLRTGYRDSFHMVGQWFPKLAVLERDGRWSHFPFYRFSEFYADFGTYDVTVDTPEGYVVGATGKLESEKAQNGRVERRFVQENVHDFAFTAWDKFREITAKSDDVVALRCLFPPGYDAVAASQVDAALEGLKHFGAMYGKYPHATLTLVHPPRGAEEAGGMEYPTLITTGGEWYSANTGFHNVELVTIHELGHQWFQGLVATNENAWPFLDEGFNSYAEGIAAEQRWPRASAGRFPGGFGISMPMVSRVPAIEVQHNDEVAQHAGGFGSGADYGALVYARTSTILKTMERVYGEDVFRKAIGTYTRRYRFGHPTPDDMLAVVREVVGADAEANLRAAIFDRAWVDYGIGDLVSNEAEPLKGVFGDPDKPDAAPVVDVAYQGRVLVRRRGTLVFPVDIDLIAADGSKKRVTWDGKGTTFTIPYSGSSRLKYAVVDPDQRIYLDANLLDNARSDSPRSVSPRVLSRGTFGAEIFMHILSP